MKQTDLELLDAVLSAAAPPHAEPLSRTLLPEVTDAVNQRLAETRRPDAA